MERNGISFERKTTVAGHDSFFDPFFLANAFINEIKSLNLYKIYKNRGKYAA